MPDDEHLAVLRRGVAAWNAWRATHDKAPDLAGARLRGLDLSGALLDGAVLSRADLGEANLRGAGLRDARLDGVDRAMRGWAARFLPGPRCAPPICAAPIFVWRGSTAPICPTPISAAPRA